MEFREEREGQDMEAGRAESAISRISWKSIGLGGIEWSVLWHVAWPLLAAEGLSINKDRRLSSSDMFRVPEPDVGDKSPEKLKGLTE